MSDVPGFLAELRRRKVVRTAGGYAVVAWIMVEVAATVAPLLQLPEWTATLVVVLALLGFPLALVLSWGFDLTPQGLERAAPGDLAPRGARSRPTAASIAAVGGVLILAAAGGAFIALRPADTAFAANRVVIDAFENRAGDPALDAVGTMAADWLVRTLQHAPSLQVVPLSVSMGSRPEGAVRARPPAEVGREFGARLVVTGAYYLEGDTLRIVAEVNDARRGELLYASDPAGAPRSAPSAGLERLGRGVAGFLATWGDFRDMGEEYVTAMRAPDFSAYREYATGFELFSRQEYRRAQPYFARAVALDSTFVSALAYGATSHSNVGDWVEAEPYLRRLSAIRDQLTPYERQAADLLEARHRGDTRAMLRAARAAAELAPNPVDHYLVTGYALRLNRGEEALEAIERIDPKGPMAQGPWYPYWTRRSRAYHMVARYEEELEVVRAGLEVHPGHPSVVGRELAALAALGRVEEALSRLEQAARSSGDVHPIARSAAAELRAHGHEEAALRAAELGAEWLRSRGVVSGEEGERNRMALLLYMARRFEEVPPLLDADPASSTVLGLKGAVAARLGDEDTARRTEAALAALEGRYLFGGPTYQRARIRALLGEREQAVRLLRQALDEGRPLDTLHDDMDFEQLRGWGPFEDLLRPQ